MVNKAEQQSAEGKKINTETSFQCSDLHLGKTIDRLVSNNTMPEESKHVIDSEHTTSNVP